MGVRQGLVSLIWVSLLSGGWTTVAFAQQKEQPKEKTSGSTPATPATTSTPAAASGASTSGSSNSCPPPTPDAENPSRLRTLTSPAGGKKFKIKADKGGNNIGLPAPANETAPNKNECYFVLAENQQDVVAEISFQKVQKNAKGVSVWVFAPVRRSAAAKSTLNLNAVRAADIGQVATSESGTPGDLLPGENPLILPSLVLIQNAQHQAANVRSGVALNIPVSGMGTSIEAFVPKLKAGIWTNMFGLRFSMLKWSAEKFAFKKPIANEVQDATATGSNLQVDLVFRYPLSLGILPRLGFFVSPVASQTEILKVSEGSVSPQNTQTLTRSGLLLGVEAELQPANNFFLLGRVTFSSKEAVTVNDESEPGDKLSGTGSVARLHLLGAAGVRLPLTSNKRFVFEGMVSNVYRSDKYSDEISYTGQGQQKDILTFFQAGLGYIL